VLGIITIVDEGLQSIFAPLWCILIWACFSAVLSMFIYKLVSPQKKLHDLTAVQKHARTQLLAHDGDFASLQQLIFKDLALSFKQIALIFPAFFITVLPVIALMFCLFVQYAYELPKTGDKLTLTFMPQEKMQDVIWPSADSQLPVVDDAGNALFTLPLPAAIPEITKESWLTTLFPNPIGVLPQKTDVESVHISLPSKHYTHFGPDWMRGFEFWYIMTLLVVSLFIKIRFKII
jgi:uncharacterized membrane protein (DUF106 family)